MAKSSHLSSVPMIELHDSLRREGLAAAFEVNELVSAQNGLVTRIRVDAPPRTTDAEGPPATAIVRVITEVPRHVVGDTELSSFALALNRLAALGAATHDGSTLRLASRLTIFEGEEHAWRKLHQPLLIAAVRVAPEATLVSSSATSEPDDESPWSAADFETVERHLSRVCVCFAGEHGFSAEFGLSDDARSAAAGHHDTSLLQLDAEEPHPLLGPGLSLRLHLPLHLGGDARILATCEHLNRRDEETADLPPHFGAWCPGRFAGSVAYAAFLPSELHRTAPNIAVNVALWALVRARWASGELEELADTP